MGGANPQDAPDDGSAAVEPARDLPRAPTLRNQGRAHILADTPTFVLPPEWKWMGLTVFLGAPTSALISFTPPPMIVFVPLLLAAALCGAGPLILARKQFEARRGEVNFRRAAITVFAVLPMFIIGVSYMLWAGEYQLDLAVAMAGLVAYTAIGGALLHRQTSAMFCAQLGCWAGVGLVVAEPRAFVSLVVMAGAAILVARQQSRIQSLIDKKRSARRRVEERARTILQEYEQTGQGWFWETDRNSSITYVSAPIAEFLGYERDDLIGRPLTVLFQLKNEEQEGERTLSFHLSARSPFQELGVRAANRDQERWWSISGRPVYDEFNNFVGFRGSGTDLTEKRRSQEKASKLARFDSLTGLANRYQMSQTLEKLLNNPAPMQRHCAIFLLDLDRFKQVNDTLGHPAGDALLKQVSQRLERVVGKAGQVGRLGGDEFKIIVAGQSSPDELGFLAENIIEGLSQPYQIEGHRVVIGVSVGIARAPADGENSEALIRNADLALYSAKDGGRGRFKFYADDMHAEAEERRELESDLRDAIATGALELYYQPVISLSENRISGFEALLRWDHPKRGMMPTQKFVDIAEDAGLIGAIGEWALRTACETLASWPEDTRCAVNVSPLQFANPQLPAIVTNAVAQAGIDPSRLELEITESVFLSDEQGTDAMFAALKRVGVRLALDDFGTGYSSLGYLKKAPFDKIKIDQSFVRGATEKGSRNGAIIASITRLANSLSMDTTAEGVETMDELELVRELGCSHVQGFIYDKALRESEARERISVGGSAVAKGPRTARPARQKMLRNVELRHGGQKYHGRIRNMSYTGVMVEGLWEVPPGTIFEIAITDSLILTATAKWSIEDRMGLEFSEPLERDGNGHILLLDKLSQEDRRPVDLRKAG